MDLDSKSQIDAVEFFFALQFRNMYPEIDQFLNTNRGKEYAISTLLAYNHFKWTLIPEISKKVSDIEELEYIPQGAVLSVKPKDSVMKVVVLDGTKLDNKHTILQVLPVIPIDSEKENANNATNFDLIVDTEFLPFQATDKHMICTWLDFPVLSSDIIEYHGKVSVLASELIRRLSAQHVDYECGLIEGRRYYRVAEFNRHVKNFIQPTDIHLGYTISTPISENDDPRIEFQNKLVSQTNFFTDKVGKHLSPQQSTDDDKFGLEIDIEKEYYQSVGDVQIGYKKSDKNIITRALKEQHSKNFTDLYNIDDYPSKWSYNLFNIQGMQINIGIGSDLKPFLGIMPSAADVQKNDIKSIHLINERRNTIIYREDIASKLMPVIYEMYLPYDILETGGTLEIEIGNTVYFGTFHFPASVM